MERAAQFRHHNSTLRWLVFFTVIANIVYSYLVSYLPGAASMKAVSNQYHSLFTPAPFTFAIWGLIYFSFLVYALVQVLPLNRGTWVYDHLARPVIFLQIMGMLWVTAFAYQLMTTSYAIIVFMLVAAAMVYGRAKHCMIHPAYSRWLTLPFSLITAWLSVALIANTAVYLLYLGVEIPEARAAALTGLLIVVAFMLSLVMSFLFRDWIFPLVTAWAFYGIYSANKMTDPALAEMSLISAVILASWGLVFAIYRSGRIRQAFETYRNMRGKPVHH